jgi:hypothetical protein
MSLVSVLENPIYAFQYPEGVNIVDTLVVRRLGAYNNETSPENIIIGATSNVNIEASENIQFYVKPTGTFDMFTTLVGDQRTDTKILEVSAPALDSTLITTVDQNLEVRGGDAQRTTIVSHTTMLKGVDGSNQFLDLPVGEVFYFGNEVNIDRGLQVTGNVVVGKSMLVSDHLITYGNIYGSNIGLWRNVDSNVAENSNVSQVGFGFRVNSNHQLELVKYSKFAEKTICKKVAIFGQAKFNETMCNDDGIEVYSKINDILGQTNLPEMPNTIGLTVDLTQPIQTYWETGPAGIFYNAGNVGISNNNPQYALDVGGEAHFATIQTDMAVIQQTSTTSDARLKNIIGNKSPNECFNTINNLNVKRYSFKNNADAVVDGFIAQEVEQVFPTAITQRKFGDLEDCRVIDYNQIIANLVGAVQYLSDIVVDIQSQ